MEVENKSFSCVLCGNKLSSKEALQEHFRKHANKEIDSKGRPVPKNGTNNEESEIIDLENPIYTVPCDVCLMNFSSVTQAIQHKFRKHPENSTKYYCPFCGMQFPLKFTRDKHALNHQGMSTLGSFPCTDCGVTFHNMGAQQYHIKSTHKRIISMFKPIPTPPPSKKIRINNANEAQSVYYCHLCGTEYIIKFNLQKHLERAHTEEERNFVPTDFIRCTTCDALFYNKKAYETHNIYHKPDDLYVTSEEQRLQTVSRVDQDFDIRRVQPTTDKFIPIDKPKPIRKKAVTSLLETKENSLSKIDLDELSPTSSIDSSDSECESNKNNSKSDNSVNINNVNINLDIKADSIDKSTHNIDLLNEDVVVKNTSPIKTYSKIKNNPSKKYESDSDEHQDEIEEKLEDNDENIVNQINNLEKTELFDLEQSVSNTNKQDLQMKKVEQNPEVIEETTQNISARTRKRNISEIKQTKVNKKHKSIKKENETDNNSGHSEIDEIEVNKLQKGKRKLHKEIKNIGKVTQKLPKNAKMKTNKITLSKKTDEITNLGSKSKISNKISPKASPSKKKENFKTKDESDVTSRTTRSQSRKNLTETLKNDIKALNEINRTLTNVAKVKKGSKNKKGRKS